MIAFHIIKTAFLNIFVDFSQTLRIFILPIMLAAAYFVALFYIALSDPMQVRQGYFLALTLAILGCLALWATVNFHRHILLGEKFGWLPKPHWLEMLRYLMLLIPMAILLAIIGFVLVMATSRIAMDFMMNSDGITSMIMISAIYSLLLGTIGLRLFATLPAEAIGDSYSFSLRNGHTVLLDIFLVTILLTALQIAGNLVDIWMTFGNLSPMTSQVSSPPVSAGVVFLYQALVGALSSVFGISLLTTIYGHYSGRRPVH